MERTQHVISFFCNKLYYMSSPSYDVGLPVSYTNLKCVFTKRPNGTLNYCMKQTSVNIHVCKRHRRYRFSMHRSNLVA